MSTINIPTIDENEYFVNIVQVPSYYISNYKRIYNLKTNQFVNCVHCIMNGTRTKLCANTLYNKYFNQPDELSLIAIIRYGKHKIKDLYYDRINNKFFKFNNGIYVEKEPINQSRNRTDKIIHTVDVNSKPFTIGLKKFKKHYIK